MLILYFQTVAPNNTAKWDYCVVQFSLTPCCALLMVQNGARATKTTIFSRIPQGQD